MSTKVEHALELHNRGCNCAQAVACSFCKEFGIDEDALVLVWDAWRCVVHFQGWQ